MRPPPKHGTHSGYVKLECREDCCKKGEREYRAGYRSRIRGVTASANSSSSSVTGQTGEKRSVAERYSDWEASLRRAAAESCDW